MFRPALVLSADSPWLKGEWGIWTMVASLMFRKFAAAAVAVLAISGFDLGAAYASDDIHILPLADALASPDAQKALDGSVTFYFGNSHHPKALQTLGEFVSNKKSNAFGKKDTSSCQRALASALVAFQKRSKALGGDAVVNIRSYYDKKEVSYDNEFECHSGFLMSGVTLKGEIVKLKP